MHVYLGAVPAPTPSPVPTSGTPGTGAFSCGVVNSGIDMINQTMSFWSKSGDLACFVIPSFDSAAVLAFIVDAISFWLPLIATPFTLMLSTFFSYITITTPAVTICFQGWEFLPINLFGVPLLIQTFVDVVLGFYIISVFSKK